MAIVDGSHRRPLIRWAKARNREKCLCHPFFLSISEVIRRDAEGFEDFKGFRDELANLSFGQTARCLIDH
jgi:hypothetical protein